MMTMRKVAFWLLGLTVMARILIVDDEPMLARILNTFLSVAGHQVAVANAGDDAVKMLQNFAPDVVVTDFHMPGMSGPELLREVRKQLPTARSLLMTGCDLSENSPFRDAFLTSGALGFLAKPFPMAKLVETVEQLITG